VALVAPRGYHGADAADDLWADPRGSWLSLVEASKVWALYGKTPALKDGMPLVNDLFVQGPVAYHIRQGGHGLTLSRISQMICSFRCSAPCIHPVE